MAKATRVLTEERENFDTHNFGDDDFYEVSVWCVNEALQRAYELGMKNGKACK